MFFNVFHESVNRSVIHMHAQKASSSIRGGLDLSRMIQQTSPGSLLRVGAGSGVRVTLVAIGGSSGLRSVRVVGGLLGGRIPVVGVLLRSSVSASLLAPVVRVLLGSSVPVVVGVLLLVSSVSLLAPVVRVLLVSSVLVVGVLLGGRVAASLLDRGLVGLDWGSVLLLLDRGAGLVLLLLDRGGGLV